MRKNERVKRVSAGMWGLLRDAEKGIPARLAGHIHGLYFRWALYWGWLEIVEVVGSKEGRTIRLSDSGLEVYRMYNTAHMPKRTHPGELCESVIGQLNRRQLTLIKHAVLGVREGRATKEAA